MPASEGTEKVDVPRFLRTHTALEDSQVVELTQFAVALESSKRWPVDLECSYYSGKLYPLQCRAINAIDVL